MQSDWLKYRQLPSFWPMKHRDTCKTQVFISSKVRQKGNIPFTCPCRWQICNYLFGHSSSWYGEKILSAFNMKKCVMHKCVTLRLTKTGSGAANYLIILSCPQPAHIPTFLPGLVNTHTSASTLSKPIFCLFALIHQLKETATKKRQQYMQHLHHILFRMR